MELKNLLAGLTQTQVHFSSLASRQVNIFLSLRNWLIGLLLSEYELLGKDRAQYGQQLFKILA